jgi:hypothetical protein
VSRSRAVTALSSRVSRSTVTHKGPHPAFCCAGADAAGDIVVAQPPETQGTPRESAYRFAGSERAYVVPSFTHFVSCRWVRTSPGSTRSHPFIRRPRISMRRALVVATSRSDCAGSTRTNTPPWPLAATAMLPPMRKASPPNIFFSVRPDSAPSSSRMRSASSSSYATAAIVHQGESDQTCEVTGPGAPRRSRLEKAPHGDSAEGRGRLRSIWCCSY